MKTQICAIKDRASDAFSQPMFMPSVGIAIRSFTDEINKADENNNLYKHPDDFDLWHLGEYDDNGANFTVFADPVQLALGKQVKIQN